MLPLDNILADRNSGEIRTNPYDSPHNPPSTRKDGTPPFRDFLDRARTDSAERNGSAERDDGARRSEGTERTDGSKETVQAVRDGAEGPGHDVSDASSCESGSRAEGETEGAKAAAGADTGEAAAQAGKKTGRNARVSFVAGDAARSTKAAERRGGAAEKEAGDESGTEGVEIPADRAGRSESAFPAESGPAAAAVHAAEAAQKGVGKEAADAKKSGHRESASRGAIAEETVSGEDRASERMIARGTADSEGARDEAGEGGRGAKGGEKKGGAAEGSRGEGAPVRIEVVDLRTEAAEARKDASSGEMTGRGGDAAEPDTGGDTRIEGRFTAASPDAGTRSADGSSEQRYVSREGQETFHRFMQQQGNAEVVRRAKVVLRNGGSGEIRLRLQPDHLGTVRISLRIEENNITGRIIVDNGEVREAFQQNLPALQRAFGSEGFQAAGLEVSVNDDGKGRRNRQGQPERSTRAAQESLNRSVPTVVDVRERGLVNLVV